MLGTDSIVDVAGFVRCDAPGTGTGAVDVGFDLGLDTADVVRAIAVNSSGDFCLAGSFWINSATRAAVCYDGASVDFTVTASPSAVEVGHAIAVDGNDNVIVGGAFHVIEDGSSPAPERKGVAAFDSSGNLLSWEHELLSGQPGDEVVRTLIVVPHALFGEVVWIGGRYTGPGFGKPSDFGYYEVP